MSPTATILPFPARVSGESDSVPTPSSLLSPAEFKFIVDGYRDLLPTTSATQSHLRGVVQDTLDHPGSLLRAQLAFSLMRAHDVDAAVARSIAVAIEYFHTASLIFDDLPCMDDATERRGHSCPHREFGEDAAILGALAFVNRGYSLLWQGLSTLPRERMTKASRLVDECLGLEGILDGQAHDLHFADSARGEEDVLRVARGKTVTLIRLTLLLPAMVAGAGSAVCLRLERLSEAWGLSYQIMDDFKDGLLQESQTGKTTARDSALNRPNLPNAIGAERAAHALRNRMAVAAALVAELVSTRPGWTPLATLHRILTREAWPFGVLPPASAAAL